MLVPFAYLDDLYLDDTSPDTMYVSVCVEHNQAIKYINFSVSLSYMGLCWDDEFEMEFSKDLQRDMNKFYSKHHQLPTPTEYKELTEIHLYC